MDNVIVGMFGNFGLLAICALGVSCFGLIRNTHDDQGIAPQLLTGAVFGSTSAILILLTTIQTDGAAVDLRAAPAVLSGVFGGPVAAVLTAVIGGAARLWVGGPFVVGGTLSLAGYCAFGLIFGAFCQRRFGRTLSKKGLVPLSVFATVAALPFFFLDQPLDVSLGVVEQVFPILLVSNLLGIGALGLALLTSLRTTADRQQLFLMQAALKQASNGITITDMRRGGSIVFVNDAIERLTGYSREEMIGKTNAILRGAETESEAIDAIRRAVQSGTACTTTLLNYRKDGTTFHNRLSLSPLTGSNGQVTHYIGVKEDVSVEIDSQRVLRTVASQVPLSLIFLNPEGQVEYVNDACHAQFGVDTDSVRGGSVVGVVGKSLEPIFGPLVERALKGHRGEADWRLEIERTDVTIDARVLCCPTLDDTGEKVGVILSIEDVTAYKQMEASLSQAQRLQSIGTLTGGIAHDFNNLNTVVIGNLELVAMTEDANERAHFIAEALKAAQRGAGLTRSLLAFGRKAPLFPDRVDLGTDLADLEGLLNASIKESTSISFTAGELPILVNVDRTNLDSAILNLVVNADQALAGATGSIKVDFRVIEADRALRDDAFAGDLDVAPMGSYAVVSVTDDGPGVQGEGRGRIIDPFYTTKGPHAGSGLGLARVHGFVRQSGGFIRIADNRPTGTVVSLYLPLLDAAACDMPGQRTLRVIK